MSAILSSHSLSDGTNCLINGSIESTADEDCGEFSALARAKIDNLKPKAIDTARLKPVPELPAEPSTPPAVQAPQLAAPTPAGWRYTCQDGSGAQQCGVISVAAGNGSPKQEAMKVTAVFSKSGKNVLIRILTPNGVYVPEGVLVSIDGNKIGRIQLTRCLPEVCMAVAELTKSTLRKLKRGNGLRVVIYEGPGTEIAFNFRLNGFTRAISQLN